MKKVLLFVSLLTLLCLPCAGYTEQRTIKIVYFDNFPPYSWLEDGKMRGILVDVATAVFQDQLGIKVIHEGYPWERAQQMVRKGDADAFITVPTPERLEYTIASKEPVLTANFNIFVRAGSPILKKARKIKSLDDLKAYKLGHYIGSGWAKKNLAGMDVQWAANIDKCLLMLKAGRFDIFIDADQVIRHSIKKLGMEKDIVEIPNALDRATWNLCMGKKSSFVQVMPRFDEALRAMTRDKSLKKIYDKY